MMNENAVYGMSREDIRDTYMNTITARLCGLEMVVTSVLSDVQHMVEHGYDKDDVRKQLNIAKFILGEMMNAKRD